MACCFVSILVSTPNIESCHCYLRSLSLYPCVVRQAIEAGLIYRVDSTGSKSAGAGAVAVLFIYIGLFTTGFQAVTWVYPSEILPLMMRQKGSAVSTAANWLVNFVVVEITPIAIQNIKWKYYIVSLFLGCGVIGNGPSWYC